MIRSDSANYWGQDIWDPDERIYTGTYDGCRQAANPDRTGRESTAPTETCSHPTLDRPGLRGLRRLESGCAGNDLSVGSGSGSSPGFWRNGFDCGPELLPISPTGMGLGQTPTARAGGSAMGMGMGTGMAVQRTPSSTDSPIHLGLRNQGSDAYWDAGISGGEDFNQKAASPKMKDNVSRLSGRRSIKRADSGCYWGAAQWDPDARIYTGAAIGQSNHLVAMLDTELVHRVWNGGLVSNTLNLAEDDGDIIMLSKIMDALPTLNDLYDIDPTPVGAGAFAVVRAGKHRATETKVTVKQMDKVAAGAKYRKSVENGKYKGLLKMTRELPHENIVQFLDFLDGPENYYDVMEPLEGPELLEQVEADFPLNEAYCQNVMQQVFAGLSHLHDRVGYVHRDVKISNFRYRNKEPRSPVVLVDFQFACPVEDEWDHGLCGTKIFMAPEVVAGTVQQEHLAATDMWSAGVILYVLLTGDCPVQEDDMKIVSRLDQEAQNLVDRATRTQELATVSIEAMQLLRELLSLDAGRRPRATRSQEHPWFAQTGDSTRRRLTTPTQQAYGNIKRLSSATFHMAGLEDDE